MAKLSILDMLYSKEKNPLEFNFDSMWMPSLYNYVLPFHIQQLNNIATSIRYNSNIEKKYKAIDTILRPLGFRKFHCGTNRIVYQFLEDQKFLMKIALDNVGINDNPAEFKNQQILKPFVTKVFEVSMCGTVGTFERVNPITSRQEFTSVAEDVYSLLVNKILGKYVLEDIGTNYFMNWGLRKGFGPCLLDFPYVYEIDGKKIFCNKLFQPNNPMSACGGEIDYDAGFNNLICSKCGKRYFAQDLSNPEKAQKLFMIKGEKTMANVYVRKGSQIILNSEKEVSYIPEPKKEVKKELDLNSYKKTFENNLESLKNVIGTFDNCSSLKDTYTKNEQVETSRSLIKEDANNDTNEENVSKEFLKESQKIFLNNKLKENMEYILSVFGEDLKDDKNLNTKLYMMLVASNIGVINTLVSVRDINIVEDERRLANEKAMRFMEDNGIDLEMDEEQESKFKCYVQSLNENNKIHKEEEQKEESFRVVSPFISPIIEDTEEVKFDESDNMETKILEEKIPECLKKEELSEENKLQHEEVTKAEQETSSTYGNFYDDEDPRFEKIIKKRNPMANF